MNSKFFSITGWILMVLAVLVPIAVIIRVPELSIYTILPFIIFLITGLLSYRLSKRESTALETWAIILMTLCLALELAFIVMGLANPDDMDRAESLAWGMAIFGAFPLILYGIGIILLIINWVVVKLKIRTINIAALVTFILGLLFVAPTIFTIEDFLKTPLKVIGYPLILIGIILFIVSKIRSK